MTRIPGIRQLQIIHLSDIHFGDKNLFKPEKSPAGDIPPTGHFPSMFESLKEDLKQWSFNNPTILAITGDLTEKGSFEEYQEAENFIRAFTEDKELGRYISLDKIFFVPGNHDMLYEKKDIKSRTHSWVEFANRLTGRNLPLPDDDDKLFPYIDLFDRYEDLGAIVVTLNSSIYVRKDSTDEDRGVLGFVQKNYVEKALEELSEEKRRNSIKIALVHHHPVLIPQLVESMKGYDAIVDSSELLGTLQSHGFHLMLHGHKHNPYIFTCDTRSALEKIEKKPMVIAAGGTLGSKELPDHPRRTNTYNLIKMCWNPQPSHLRISITTRGLVRHKPDGRPLNPINWCWETLCEYDESFFGYEKFPLTTHAKLEPYSEEYKELDIFIEKKNKESRGCFPVYEFRPSLNESNSYEVILWIEYNPISSNSQQDNIPEEVIWYVNKSVAVRKVHKNEDASFSMKMSYSNPFLILAKICFPDGYVFLSEVLVRLPINY